VREVDGGEESGEGKDEAVDDVENGKEAQAVTTAA
jgi:hypothetical protein